jgi:two-component system, NtrC family, sensor kinase
MQRRTILTVIAILLLSLPVLTWLQLHRQLQHELEQQYAFVNQLYTHLSEQRLALLHAVADQIALREDVQQALRSKDRLSLLELMQPVLAQLSEKHGIGLLYFHDGPGKTLLRVHQPDRAGDRINRYLLNAALHSRGAVQGLEIGSQGLLSLRVIRPLQVDGTLLGFIEIGEDIDGVVQQLKAITGSRLLLTVDKDFISREKWEAGLQLTGRQNAWEMLSDSVIPHAFSKHFSSEMLSRIFEQERKVGDTFRFVVAGEHHAGKLFPLRDTVPSVVGELLIVRNITYDNQCGQLVLLGSILVSIVLGALLMVILRRDDPHQELGQPGG